MTVLNLAAYRFVPIADPTLLADRVRELCQAGGLKGSVLVAPEGINLFLAGAPENLRDFIEQLRSDVRLTDLQVKLSVSESLPFRRLRVRVKREIISFGRQSRAPGEVRAATLSPERLRDWMRQGHDDEGRELVLLDTRNRQEVAFGTFREALCLPIERFTQFRAAIDGHREALRGKAVVSFCTGGIRCEKAALWMEDEGMANVHQLEGGILGYFEKVGAEGFEGHCFVFDERVALDPQLQPIRA